MSPDMEPPLRVWYWLELERLSHRAPVWRALGYHSIADRETAVALKYASLIIQGRY